ncbi:phage morphogenesis protein [Riemerella columbipharyngis]|uniref:Phage virion morphogenesis family protein n=1 Tax=Riemerella columbipharyngis TaxID=1071918 RepID=A0A1G7FLI2_9FLAO|nr:phage morphogenesis protein [Riemerella columbipharyngis]SDE76709.1 hypothetical protein SAMN05421544_1247 [Riemerella columbipharyngis]
MANNLKDLEAKLKHIAEVLPDKCLSVIEVEGKNFIAKNFREQGFADNGLEKWKTRKTTDRKGRDLTRYRTNRRGKQGELTKFGRENLNRAILVGHNTGGDKLKNSFRVRRENQAVIFSTYKEYARYHNEGTEHLPKRQFMGESKHLTERITNKIDETIKKLFQQ